MEIPFLTVQTIENLGKLPLIPLSPEGGAQSAADISPVMEDKSVNAVLLANHGGVGGGPTLMEAQYFAELVEETATPEEKDESITEDSDEKLEAEKEPAKEKSE